MPQGIQSNALSSRLKGECAPSITQRRMVDLYPIPYTPTTDHCTHATYILEFQNQRVSKPHNQCCLDTIARDRQRWYQISVTIQIHHSATSANTQLPTSIQSHPSHLHHPLTLADTLRTSWSSETRGFESRTTSVVWIQQHETDHDDIKSAS